MARGKRPGGGLPDTGLSDDELPDRLLVEQIWRVMQRWAVPVMMSLAYMFLAATSETNTTGKLWMGVGLGFVLVVWFVFRRLAENAALARALGVGDVVRLDELAPRARPGRRIVARALARQLRGEPAAALAVLDGEPLPEGDEVTALAAVVRIIAMVELGQPAGACRELIPAAPRMPALAWLAEGLVAWRAEQPAEAARWFAQVIDDIRAGSAARAIAHLYAARLAELRGEPAIAARHRAAAAAMATPEATWLRPITVATVRPG